MALDFIVIGISITVLLFYLMTLFFLLEIRARISGKSGLAFLLLMFGVLALILRRLEYIFFVSDLITIPYFRDVMSLVFSVLVFFSAYLFYKSITSVTDIPEWNRIRENFKSYRERLRRKIKKY